MSSVPFDPAGDPVQVSEADYFAADREADEKASCAHLNVSEEVGRPNRGGHAAVYRVCEDCGYAFATGEETSVL